MKRCFLRKFLQKNSNRINIAQTKIYKISNGIVLIKAKFITKIKKVTKKDAYFITDIFIIPLEIGLSGKFIKSSFQSFNSSKSLINKKHKKTMKNPAILCLENRSIFLFLEIIFKYESIPKNIKKVRIKYCINGNLLLKKAVSFLNIINYT